MNFAGVLEQMNYDLKIGSTRGPSQMAKKRGQPKTISLDPTKQIDYKK